VSSEFGVVSWEKGNDSRELGVVRRGGEAKYSIYVVYFII